MMKYFRPSIRSNRVAMSVAQSVLTLLLLVVAGLAQAQTSSSPRKAGSISYQAVVTTSDGSQARDGAYTVHARLYEDADGLTPVWEAELHAVVTGGVLSLELGDIDHPLPAAGTLAHGLFLGLSLNNEGEMRPLTKLNSTPTALSVADNAIATSSLQDGAVTAAKINTEYVAGVSVNGKHIANRAAQLNFVSGEGLEMFYDQVSGNIVLRPASGSALSSKGGELQTVDLDVKHDALFHGNVTFGDDGTETMTFNAKAASDLDMNLYSLNNADSIGLGKASTKTGVASFFNQSSSSAVRMMADASSGNRLHHIPNVGLDANFLMSEGTQSAGAKLTLLDTLKLGSTSAFTGALSLYYKNALKKVTLLSDSMCADRTYRIPEVKNNAKFLMSEGLQTANARLTLQDSLKLGNTGVFSGTLSLYNQASANKIIISSNAASGDRSYKLIDVGSNANFVMSEGTQTANAKLTLQDSLKLGNTGVSNGTLSIYNQASANKITVSSDAASGDRSYKLTDVGANANFLMSEGTQTSNAKVTWQDTIKAGSSAAFNGAISVYTVGSPNKITVSSSGASADRSYKLPDVGANANFIMSEGSQTSNAKLTMQDTVKFGSSAAFNGALSVYTVGSPSKITVSSAGAAADRSYTLPDVGANANFIMSEGSQTANAKLTLQDSLKLGSAAAFDGALALYKQGSPNKITVSSAGAVADRSYKLPDVGANANFLMSEGSQTSNAKLTMQDTVKFGSSAAFSGALSVYTAGSPNKITVSSAGASADRSYKLPDVGANANFLMSEGAQTANGKLTMTDTVKLGSTATSNGALSVYTLGSSNKVTVVSDAMSANRTYRLPDVGTDAAFLMSEGTQSITGKLSLEDTLKLGKSGVKNGALAILNSTNNKRLTILADSIVTNRTYKIPDVGMDAVFLMSEGQQAIKAKIFFESAAPNHDNIGSLGDPDQRFADLFLGPHSLHLSSTPDEGVATDWTSDIITAPGDSLGNYRLSEGDQTVMTMANNGDMSIMGGVIAGDGLTTGSDILPATEADNSLSIGTPDTRFSDIYLGPHSLHLSSTPDEGVATDWVAEVITAGDSLGNYSLSESGTTILTAANNGDITIMGGVIAGDGLVTGSDIIPADSYDNTVSVGSPDSRFADVYLGPHSLHLSSTPDEGVATDWTTDIITAPGDSLGNYRMMEGDQTVMTMSNNGDMSIMGGVVAGDGVMTGSDILPTTDADNLLSIGTPDTRFSDIYLGPHSLHLSSTPDEGVATDWVAEVITSGDSLGNYSLSESGTTIMTASNNGDITITGGVIAGDGLVTGSDIVPDQSMDNLVSVGSPDVRFSDLFLGPHSLHLMSTTQDMGGATPRDWVIDVITNAGPSQGALQVMESGSQRLAISPAGDLTISGSFSAPNLSGDGSQLVNLNASQLTTGTVPNARLSGTYANALTLSNAANAYTGASLSVSGIATSGSISTGAVSAGAVSAGAVTSTSLTTGPITSGDVNAQAVTSTSLSTGAITAANINAADVTSTSLTTGNVTAADVTAEDVTAADVSAADMTSTSLTTGAITAGNVNAQAVTSTSLSTGDIASGDISAANVTSSSLTTGTITSGDINAQAVSSTSLSTGAITSGDITSGDIASGNISAENITAGDIDAGDVTSLSLATGAITSGNVNAQAITSTSLSTGGITAGDMTADDINANSLTAMTVSATDVSASTVTATDVNSTTVTATTVGAESVLASGDISGQTLTLSGNATTGGLVTGDIESGNIVAGNVSASDVSALTVNTTDVEASGAVTADAVNSATLSVSGAANVGSLSTDGNINAAAVIATGDVSAATLTSAGMLFAASATIDNGITSSTLTTSGNISSGANISAAGNISASGDVVATGNITATGNVTSFGNATISGDVTSTGAMTASTVTTGTLTADAATINGLTDGVLHSTSGALSTSAVDLTSEVSGILPVDMGGTGAGAQIPNAVVFAGSGGAYSSSDGLMFIANTGALTVGTEVSNGSLTVNGSTTVSGNISNAGSLTSGYATISAGDAIGLPTGVTVITITDDASENANALTMPSGVDGQLLDVYNADAEATTGDFAIPAGAAWHFFYAAGAWRHAQ